MKCPRCYSSETDIVKFNGYTLLYECFNCGYIFEAVNENEEKESVQG
jgi:uncharacterized Zn finger protein